MTDLQEDIAQEVKEGTARLLPEGPAPAGYVATVTSAAPFRVAYVQPPRKELLHGHGDPNALIFAEKGIGLYVDLDAPGLWQNADGGTTWVQVGSGSLITDSYYEFIDDTTTTGNAYNAGDISNLWTASGLSGFNNGSDVALSSGVVTIQTTGVYSIAATWSLKADTAADGYTYARGRFTLGRVNEPGSPVHDQVFLDDAKTPAVFPSDNKHFASFACSVTSFMYAGDQVILEGRFEAATSPGSTWSFETASMYVERLT